MRLDLRDGQWAEIREHISHGQDKEIKRAQWRARSDPTAAISEGDTTALRVFIKSWSVNDPDGNPIPLTDGNAIERMPSDIADEIAVKVNAIYHPEATVPNAPTPPPSDA